MGALPAYCQTVADTPDPAKMNVDSVQGGGLLGFSESAELHVHRRGSLALTAGTSPGCCHSIYRMQGTRKFAQELLNVW